MSFLLNPSFWASLAALLIIASVCFALGWINRIILIIAAVCAVVGIVETLWNAGHKIRYIKPGDQP